MFVNVFTYRYKKWCLIFSLRLIRTENSELSQFHTVQEKLILKLKNGPDSFF